MNGLLSYHPGWTLEVPAGTLFIRADVVMNTRPGAGGYSAVLEARDMQELILLRGGEPDTSTERMIQILAVRLAQEIKGNRAVILTRNLPIQQGLADIFKRYNMIRVLGHSPMAVSDTTRHAAVMAERCQILGQRHEDRFLISRHEPNDEDFNENQDVKSVHAALQHLVKTVGVNDLNNPVVQKAAQDLLDAAERERLAIQKKAIRKLTAHDIPKATQSDSYV